MNFHCQVLACTEIGSAPTRTVCMSMYVQKPWKKIHVITTSGTIDQNNSSGVLWLTERWLGTPGRARYRTIKYSVKPINRTKQNIEIQKITMKSQSAVEATSLPGTPALSPPEPYRKSWTGPCASVRNGADVVIFQSWV